MKEQHSSHFRKIGVCLQREFVVASGASMHMISRKDLSNAEMDTLTKSCSPTIVITANGEVQTHEEAIVYVKELDIFLTLKALDNTPAALSIGKLCDDNGYSEEWINCRKPRQKKLDSDTVQHGEFRFYRGSRLVKSSASQQPELNKKIMENLRHSAANGNGGEGTYDVFYLTTGVEPNGHDFNELQNSSVTLSFKILAADQDVDDLPRTSRLLRTRRRVSQSVVVVCKVR